VAIPRGNASIVYGASYHVRVLPSVIICDDVAKDPSDCTSVKSYFSESQYSARYFLANKPWPMTMFNRIRARPPATMVSETASLVVGGSP